MASESIYVGPEQGSGGGGGGSTNPTSGVVPVNIFGTFEDSNFQSDQAGVNNTRIAISDSSEIIVIEAGANNINIDGNNNTVDIQATDVNLTGDVNVNTHLGLALLRFLGSTAVRPAIKANGNDFDIRNGNDTAYRSVTALNFIATGFLKTVTDLVFDVFGAIRATADGVFMLINNAGTSFSRLCFGGTTSAFPAIKRNGAGLTIVAADDSANANLLAKDVTSSGNTITENALLFSASSPRGSLSAPTDGFVLMQNAAGTDFKRLQFGGTTSAFPAIVRLSNGLNIKLADDSAFAQLTALDLIANGYIQTSADVRVTARSILSSLVDGNFTLYNQAKTAFSLLQFGGISNAFPALKRNATAVNVRLADDSADAPLTAAAITASGNVTSSTGLYSSTVNVIVGVSSSTPIIRGSISGVQIAASAGAANASAQLEVVSTSRGFLPPRMTAAQRTAITTPAVGLMVYQTDVGATEGIWTYKSTGWVQGV